MMNGWRVAADALTAREIEILRLIEDGFSNQEIAEKLSLSLGTVKWYNTQIFTKLGVKNRTQAIARTRELGLLNKDGHAAPHTPSVQQLPAQTFPFIGREKEVKAISALLESPETRLVSLIGPGGIGKTSLAVEVARRMTEQFPNGVYFVALSPLSSPEDILPMMANAVGFQFKGGENPRQQLLSYFSGKRLLLLMDNFDELLDGATLVADILRAAPGVTILTTSRERLNLQEEIIFRVEGMKLSEQDAAGETAYSDAVQLFVQSARHAQPDFEVGADNLDDIARICRLVEGMPLGILLAAAWVGMLTLSEIADEITTSLDFLETETRNVPERHRSIRGVFESTLSKLTEAERTTFARLSVFRGGFTREAAQQVTGEGLRTLMVLANKSLLRRDANGRYSIHELLRQYAWERLSGEHETTQYVHSRYYLNLLAQVDENPQPEIQDQIEADFENIRAAWNWAVDRHESDALENALHSLYDFCTRRTRFQDAEKLLNRALEMAEQHTGFLNPETLLRLRECRGKMRSLMGDFAGAVADLEHVRRAAHTSGDAAWERDLLIRLGQLYRKSERNVEAIQHLNSALQSARRGGDQRAIADILYHLGTVSWDEGDNTQATAYHQEAVDIYRRLRIRDVVGVQALHGMGEALLMSGQPERAYDCFRESLELSREISDRTYEAENMQMVGWTSIGSIGTANYNQAIEHFSRALAISEAGHLDWHSVCSLIGLGLAQSSSGDYQQGLDHIQRGCRLAETLKITRFIAMALDGLGQLYQDLNLLNRAEIAHTRGMELMLRSESTYWLPRLQANLAIDRLRQGDMQVEGQLHEALNIALSRNQGMHAARCLEGLAEYYLARGDLDQSLKFADQLLRLGQSGGLREMVAQAHRWQGEALLVAGKLEQAERELRQAGTAAADIGSVRLLWDVHAALEKLYLMQGHDEAAQLHQAAVRGIVAQIAQNLPNADLRAGLPQLELA